VAAALVFALLDLGTRPAQRAPAPAQARHEVEDEPPPCPVAVACPSPPPCPLAVTCPAAVCEVCPDCPEAAAGFITLLRRCLRAAADWDDGALWAIALAIAAGCSRLLGRFQVQRPNGAALGRLRAYT
jgi:hypothetical protein